jgi:hypothetical protein
MVVAPVTHSIPDEDLLPEDDELFVPYHAEEGPYEVCWTCHGFLVGPPGRRLCACHEPAPLPPGLAEKARVLDGMRDALAEAYRRRWFRLLLRLIGDADRAEARAAWDALWPVARRRAARLMEERGLSL